MPRTIWNAAFRAAGRLRGKSPAALRLERLEGREVPARVWYVSPNGNDWGSGAVDQPVATVAPIAWQLSPGDEVRFLGGTYNLRSTVSLYQSGTAAAPIRVTAAPGQHVVLNAAGLPGGASAVSVTGNFVQVSGLEVDDSPGIGIAVWGGSSDTIGGNVVQRSALNGIYVGYGWAGATNNDAVQGNTVVWNSLANRSLSASGGWTAAVTAQYTAGFRCVGNAVSDNYGEGINVLLSDGADVAQNAAHDNYSANYYLDNATNATVERNLSYSTGDSRFYRFGMPAVGVQLANEIYATSNRGHDDRIVNNLLLGGRYGFYYGNYGFGGGLKNDLIAGNAIYGSVGASLHIDGDAHSGTAIEDNIVEQHAGYAMVDYNGTDGMGGLGFRSNLWYGGRPEVGAGPGDVYANPLFANPGGNDPSGYRLQANSPAIGAGAAVPGLANDYFGTTRPADRTDLGAAAFVGLSPATAAGYAVNGSAFALGGHFQLTNTDSQNQAGSAFTSNRVGVAGFTTQFTFQIANPNADGFTFALQNAGPSALGWGGGGLGYAGIGQSVALKFDLYDNGGEGNDSIGLYAGGAAPIGKATDLTGTGIDLHSGHVFQVQLAYDGQTLTVTIADTQTGAVYGTSYAIDIVGAVGGPAAYVGFTGGTGGLTCATNILGWTYSPNVV